VNHINFTRNIRTIFFAGQDDIMSGSFM